MRLLQVASILLLYKNLQSDQQNNTDDTQNSTGNSHTAVLQLRVVHSQAAGRNSYSTKDETEDKEAHNTAHQRDNRQGLCLLRLSLLLRGLNGHTVRNLLIELGCLLAKLGVLVELGLGVVGVFRHDLSFR